VRLQTGRLPHPVSPLHPESRCLIAVSRLAKPAMTSVPYNDQHRLCLVCGISRLRPLRSATPTINYCYYIGCFRTLLNRSTFPLFTPAPDRRSFERWRRGAPVSVGLKPTSCGFVSRLRHYSVTILGNLFTPRCQAPRKLRSYSAIDQFT